MEKVNSRKNSWKRYSGLYFRKSERICRFVVKFLIRYRTTAFTLSSVLFFLLSFWVTPYTHNVSRESARLERKIRDRQQMLGEYARQALDCPVEQWLDIPDFPEDMVLYKYNADTLQSWINQFPINNDDVDVLPLWYRLMYLNNGHLYNTPLAYLAGQEQYVNLGSAWYAVKVYREGNVKVITGLLIKTEYLSNNAVLSSRINPELGKYRKISLVPVNFDEGAVVRGIDGGVLFSVLDDVSPFRAYSNWLRWAAAFLALCSLFSYYYNRRSWRAFAEWIGGITILRLLCFHWAGSVQFDVPIFSPNIYADAGIFSSLGNFLLNNLYVFLVVLGFSVMQRRTILFFSHFRGWRRIGWNLLLSSTPLLLGGYIHYTLKSLIRNSNVVLELYRLEEVNVYSILCYLSYGLLFVALLLLLRQVLLSWRCSRRHLFGSGFILFYLASISLYSLITVSTLGFKKESERARVWTNRLSVERDMGLELHLRSIEGVLESDLVTKTLLDMPQNMESYLQRRLEELYFLGISQRYEIRLEICRPNERIRYQQGGLLADCNAVYQRELERYGVPLAAGSHFYFLNNYNGRISYLGKFTYPTFGGFVNLYIELDSRYMKDVIGYPSLLFDYKQADNFNLPGSYSYAKYINNRLILYRGRYNYPITIDENTYKDGFSVHRRDKYLHFVNKFSPDNIIVISRPARTAFPYIVTFSYLMLFYALILFLFFRIRALPARYRRLHSPRNSFRRKITYLLTMTLAVSLICLGVGSVWFSLNFFEETNRLQMEEKLQTVQNSLSDMCKYAAEYRDINRVDLYRNVDRMANTTQADINLYDPHGNLIHSTQPELFERYLLASRINYKAYYQLIYQSKKQVINQEKIADLSYYSLYAPVFNNAGKLIAIVNIPYFSKANLKGDASSIIAAIVNIYILLLLAAILGGTMISNSLARPLEEISRKMQRIDVSRKAEHINYRNRDELGTLVQAYNHMVDDLEESTKQLAQNEREHAWSEMARQIAHEIKNPLTPMRLSIQHLILLKKRNVEGWQDKFEEVAGSILEQIDILSDTASEFSSFAKFYYEESTELNLYSLVAEQKILFDTRDNIRMVFVHESEYYPVIARKGQIIRVIVNLLSNAVQAVEEKGGYIRIRISQQENRYTVSVEDNGNGVKEEDISKLFKPNFTTKSSGTGLGLAICRNIIEQSGGKVAYARSELGGAAFSFWLPAAPVTSAADKSVSDNL